MLQGTTNHWTMHRSVVDNWTADTTQELAACVTVCRRRGAVGLGSQNWLDNYSLKTEVCFNSYTHRGQHTPHTEYLNGQPNILIK